MSINKIGIEIYFSQKKLAPDIFIEITNEYLECNCTMIGIVIVITLFMINCGFHLLLKAMLWKNAYIMKWKVLLAYDQNILNILYLHNMLCLRK